MWEIKFKIKNHKLYRNNKNNYKMNLNKYMNLKKEVGKNYQIIHLL